MFWLLATQPKAKLHVMHSGQTMLSRDSYMLTPAGYACAYVVYS